MTLKPASLQWAADGSFANTFYGDIYYLQRDGQEEKHYVFIDGNDLPARFAAMQGSFTIGETGFGTGLNFLLAARLFLDTAPPHARLFYAAIEKHPILPRDLARIHAALDPAHAALADELRRQYPPVMRGFHHLFFAGGRVRLMICFGDVIDVLPQMDGRFDAWFLDGFTPSKNPDMWREDSIHHIARLTKPSGTLASFSAAGGLRETLSAAGFHVTRTKGFKYKRHMTSARMTGTAVPQKPPATIAVIGAGIAGCAAAFALARQGCRVTLLERGDDVAAGASGNPAAMIYPKLAAGYTPHAQYHRHSFGYSRAVIDHLQIPSFRATGVLHRGRSDEDRVYDHHILSETDYPDTWAHTDGDGVFHATGGFLSPHEYCRQLIDHPLITLHTGTTTTDIAALRRQYDAVVIAAAQSSAALIPAAGFDLIPLRGQVTTINPTPQSRALSRVIAHTAYITPVFNDPLTGRLIHCIGATFNRHDSDETPRDADDIENIEKLNTALPALGITAAHIAGHRAGLRMTTPDRYPLVGVCPHHQGVYVTTGFTAHGMTAAVMAGDMLAAQICGLPAPVPRDVTNLLDPARFIRRAEKIAGKNHRQA